MSRLLAGVLAAAALTVTACEDFGAASRLHASPNFMHFDALLQADTATVVFEGYNVGGPAENIVVWETADASVATVRGNGEVVATGNGETVITVRNLGRTATIQVSVAQVPTKLDVGPIVTTVPLGHSIQGFASVEDRGANPILNPPVVWSSLSPNILSVTPTGQIKALAAGQGAVLARVGGLSKQLTFIVQ